MTNAAVHHEGESEPWRYSRRGERLPDHCLDCGAAMLGPYCASCGQKNEPEHRSLWQLVKDAVGPAVLLESKLWRTLGPLLGRPGALSEAYTEGRRSRYIRPLRLYFWVSVLFFTALALGPAHVATVNVNPEAQVHLRLAPALEKRLREKLESFKGEPAQGQAATKPGEPAVDGRALATERLRSEFLSRLPKALFLLLPVFALLLRALWWKRPYVDHLVLALHAHTVLFLGLGIGLIGWWPLKAIGVVGPIAWFLLAAHRFYRSGWVSTVLKTLVLGVLDGVLVVLVVMLTTLVALLGT
ncbi:MAG TPA: DUF3667 domain-containing protein [Myxococcaceae bacterium]|nr:DUF3667 domain-containing protein [Myxococcaceae bacterium]